MKNELEPVLINEDYLKDKIYIIRGQKVMLDSDLAIIYGISTKRLNEQVKRNIEKFEEDFMFRLTNEEVLIVRSQNATSRNKVLFKGQDGGTRYLPNVFTEQGLYMLMTILKGPLAISQSKYLIRSFKILKDCYFENKSLLQNDILELRTTILEKDIKEIKMDNKKIKIDLNNVMDNFIDSNTYKHFLLLDGHKLEADIAYKNIFGLAKKSIIYIDDYISIKTLDILSFANDGVSITVISDNKAKPKLKESIVNDYINQNKNNKLTILKNNNKCHDRFIILDFNTINEKIYLCGSSLKDAGNKITTIIEIIDTKQYVSTIKKLLNHSLLKI